MLIKSFERGVKDHAQIFAKYGANRKLLSFYFFSFHAIFRKQNYCNDKSEKHINVTLQSNVSIVVKSVL